MNLLSLVEVDYSSEEYVHRMVASVFEHTFKNVPSSEMDFKSKLFLY